MSNAKATLFRGQRWAECARGCMGVGDNGRATAEWRHGRCRTRVSTFWSVKVQIVSIFRFMNDTAPITTTLCYCITKATTETLEANGRVGVRINLYLWTLNFEFQRSFTCHKIFSFFFFNRLKMWGKKIFFSSLDVKIGDGLDLALRA